MDTFLNKGLLGQFIPLNKDYRTKLFALAVCNFVSVPFITNESEAFSLLHAANNSVYSVEQSEVTVKGKVLDELGQPVIGANVLIEGTTNGVITDLDGAFTLNVPSLNSFLLVSYIGYDTQRVKVTTKQTMVIKLEENSMSLEEVVVVGYGSQKKESVVGAISQVDNKAILEAGTTNITNAISGKLSGVLTVQSSGQPGQNKADIIIRGVSSWNGNGPLVLVDGVERDFSDIDPNEINTISVLKDASATAVFGAKGANGVIIVTTKRGNVGKPKIDFKASYGVSWIAKKPQIVGAEQTLNGYNVAKMNTKAFSELQSQEIINKYVNPSSPLESLQYPDVDWFDVMTKDFAATANANFSVNGGTDFIKYFCSLGYTHEGDMFETYNGGKFHNTNYSYDRLNYRTNLDFNISKSTTFQFNVGGDISMQNEPVQGADGGFWRPMYATSNVSFPAYYPAWVLEQIPDSDYPDASGDRLATNEGRFAGLMYNPYTMLRQGSYNKYTASKLFTDLIFNQKLDFITPGLSVGAKVSYSTYFKTKSQYANYSFPEYRLDWENIGTDANPWFRRGQDDTVWAPPSLDVNVGGLENGYQRDLYYEASINYNRTFGNHSVTGLLLFNRQDKRTTADFPYLNEAWVGRVTYNFGGRYFAEVNIGYTGSEKFAPGKRFGFFPSGAVGYMLSEEKFFKENISWINKLKFRYSDGLVGSDHAPNRWLYFGEFSESGGIIYEDAIPNMLAQWEEARKQDIGVEIGLLDNMIMINADWYNEKRTNMLLTPRKNLFIGNTFKDLNMGALKKHGYEVEVEFNKTTNYGLYYNVKCMLGFNENRIIEKDDLPYAPEYQREAGKPWGGMNSGNITTDSGYMTSVDDVHNNPSPTSVSSQIIGDYKYLDYNADGKIDANDKFSLNGSTYAPYTFSLGGGLRYKGFEFSLLFAGALGKYTLYDNVFQDDFWSSNVRLQSIHLDYWSPTNLDANHHSLRHFTSGSDPNFAGIGSLLGRNWRKSDFIRLKDVYIAYNLKTNKLKNIMGVNGLTFYLSGNNLLTFTNLPEGDPESRELTDGYYPQLASMRCGIKVGF